MSLQTVCKVCMIKKTKACDVVKILLELCQRYRDREINIDTFLKSNRFKKKSILIILVYLCIFNF